MHEDEEVASQILGRSEGVGKRLFQVGLLKDLEVLSEVDVHICTH